MFEGNTFQQKAKVYRTLMMGKKILTSTKVVWDGSVRNTKDVLNECLSHFSSDVTSSLMLKTQTSVALSMLWKEFSITLDRNKIRADSWEATYIVVDFLHILICDLNSYIPEILSKTYFTKLRNVVQDLGEHYAQLGNVAEDSKESTILYLRLKKSLESKFPKTEHWSGGMCVPVEKWSARNLLEDRKSRSSIDRKTNM